MANRILWLSGSMGSGHHPKSCDASDPIEQVYNEADFHPSILDTGFFITENGENSAQDHECGIAGDDDFGSWGCKSPGKGSQRQNGPGEKQQKRGNSG